MIKNFYFYTDNSMLNSAQLLILLDKITDYTKCNFVFFLTDTEKKIMISYDSSEHTMMLITNDEPKDWFVKKEIKEIEQYLIEHELLSKKEQS